MSTELYLKHITPEQLNQLHKYGLAVNLDNLYEQIADDLESWLLLDEHILAFMSRQDLKPSVLYIAVLAGNPFADSAEREDFPRFFTADEVQDLAQALNRVSAKDLQTRFEAMREEVGGTSINGTDDEAFARLQDRFQAVAAHYQAAAQQGKAMLLLLF